MFIKHKKQKERVNLARCTNYHAQDYTKLGRNGDEDRKIYQIVFMFSEGGEGQDCAIWNFETWEERDKVLELIDGNNTATEINSSTRA